MHYYSPVLQYIHYYSIVYITFKDQYLQISRCGLHQKLLMEAKHNFAPICLSMWASAQSLCLKYGILGDISRSIFDK